MNFTDNKSIGVFINNETSTHGIFSFLHELNGEYRTRYSIVGYGRGTHTHNCVDKFHESSCYHSDYWSVSGATNISFIFDAPIFVTGYTIFSGDYDSKGNSYPKEWKLFGKKENGRLELIDKREDQKFCAQDRCIPSVAKTYKAKYQRNSYKEIIFFIVKNSYNVTDYLFLKAIDFFGILCGKNERCIIPFNRVTCSVKQRNTRLTLFFICLFVS